MNRDSLLLMFHEAGTEQTPQHSRICLERRRTGDIYSKSLLTIINCHSLCNLENTNEKFSEFGEASQKDSLKVFSISITRKKKEARNLCNLKPLLQPHSSISG